MSNRVEPAGSVPVASSALVLGGGGVTGVAWEIGMLAGLAEAGVDLTAADLVVGTSAGSVVGAQITTGTPVADLYRAQLDSPGGEMAAKIGGKFILTMLWSVARWSVTRTRDPQAYLRRVGAMALAAKTVPEHERRAVIEARLPVHDWPPRGQRLLITAVDAGSGEFVVFDADAGVSLVDAVGASCAVPSVWPPVTIGDRRFIDGGMRSATNADLAAGAARVIVIAPLTAGGGPVPKLADQVGSLRAAGASVLVITPDKAAKEAIGPNLLDPARRAQAATAGHTQAGSVAGAVREIWAGR